MLQKLLYKLIFMAVLFSTPAFSQTHYSYKERISLAKLFDQARLHRAFPGGCVQVGTAKKILLSRCYGYFTYAEKTPDQTSNLFDLASLTKVIATTTSIMKLYDAGKIHLKDKLVKYIPGFASPTARQARIKSTITILQLLTHTSGLPADNNVRFLRISPAQRLQAMIRTPVVNYPGVRYKYSDVNFVLLGEVVKRISGMPLNKFVRRFICRPLEMKKTTFQPNNHGLTHVVPTEYQKATHSLLKGMVQDPTARSLGGVAGNAGLFSTVGDLGAFARMMLNKGKFHNKTILQAKTIALFTRRADLIPANSRALGWDTVYNPKIILPPAARAPLFQKQYHYKRPHQFTAGVYINPNAYGHTGYTGTSIWMSQKDNLYVILLTNRLTPQDNTGPTEKYFRQAINSAIWRNLGFVKKNLTYLQPKPS